jgi:hypothetical protein
LHNIQWNWFYWLTVTGMRLTPIRFLSGKVLNPFEVLPSPIYGLFWHTYAFVVCGWTTFIIMIHSPTCFGITVSSWFLIRLGLVSIGLFTYFYDSVLQSSNKTDITGERTYVGRPHGGQQQQLGRITRARSHAMPRYARGSRRESETKRHMWI